MPGVSPAGGVAGVGGRRAPGRLRRPGVLGPAGARLRRPGGDAWRWSGWRPAAHGANRTGRVFTGDRSGDWLFRALYRAGYANRAESIAAGDGLVLTGAWVTAAVRCAPPANRPTPEERDRCAPYLARELALLDGVRVVVALGGFAYRAVARWPGCPRGPGSATWPRRPCRTAASCWPRTTPASRTPSPGTLTEEMFDAVFARARALGA